MPIEEYQVTVTNTADAVEVDVSVSLVVIGVGAAFLLLASMKDPHALAVVLFWAASALIKMRVLIGRHSPVLTRSFVIAGVPVFSRRYEISQAARLRYRSKQRTTELQLDLVDSQLTIMKTANEILLDRAAKALYEPLSKWTGPYTIA
jgi:hypothetical protein